MKGTIRLINSHERILKVYHYTSKEDRESVLDMWKVWLGDRFDDYIISIFPCVYVKRVRKDGMNVGSVPKISTDQIAQMEILYKNNGYTFEQVAKQFKISTATAFRKIKYQK